MKLYFDIETIPSQRPEVRARIEAKVKEPNITKTGRYKSQEDIEVWKKEERPLLAEEDWRNTGLDSALGEIISIAWAIDDEPAKVSYRTLDEPEAKVLGVFLSDVSQKAKYAKPIWIGHYITGFDLRFIWHRCIINNIAPTVKIPYDAKPWDGSVFDTKVEWSGLKGGISQDDLCFALGLEGKPNDIDGSKVWDFVKAGQVKRVAEYNIHDVEQNRKIYKRMTFQA